MNKLFSHSLTALLILTLTVPVACAQKKGGDDYNLRKAYEAFLDENDPDKALELVEAQLVETPNNAEAFFLRGRIRFRAAEFGNALSDFSRAAKLNNPKKTDLEQSLIYWWRSYVQSAVDDESAAADDLKKALELARKEKSENWNRIAFDYGQTLRNLDRFDESDAVYHQMLEENETDSNALVGLAANLIYRDRHAEAVTLLDRAEALRKDNPDIYHFRMLAYDGMGETKKAIDDCVSYIDLGPEDVDLDELADQLIKQYNYSVAKLKSTANKSEYPVYCQAVLSVLYVANKDYVQGIKQLDMLERDYGGSVHNKKAECYSQLNMVDKAVEEATIAINEDPGADSYRVRGQIYREAGLYDEAIADFTAAIEEEPDFYYLYYQRGWSYELKGDLEKAMADYNLGLDMDDDYAYLYLMRGELRLLLGDEAKAREDFGQVLQRDTVATDVSCRMYALHFLGRDGEAEEWMQKIIDENPKDEGHYYDKACLYSRMGKLEEAVEAFKKCLELGYSSFGHIENDDDVDAIRDREDFKAAVEEAKRRLRLQCEALRPEASQTDTLQAQEESPLVSEIDVKRRSGGTFEVPCEINGLPLKMIFDTGASDVTISSVEANFMLKNDYLNSRDVKGKRYYQIANGALAEGTVITLREVKIGDAVLRDVDASVVNSQSAPLLFGQSAMEKFGVITIDNQNNKLIIKR